MRQKKELLTIPTAEEASEIFASYNNAISALKILEGEINTAKTAIDEKYSGRIGTLQSQRDASFEQLQAFAEANPGLFEKKKSYELTHGTLGFRTGTPKLSLLKGFKWEGVLKLVKTNLPGYINTTDTLNKEQLLADRDKLGDKLGNVGVCVAQAETFYVSPNLQEIST